MQADLLKDRIPEENMALLVCSGEENIFDRERNFCIHRRCMVSPDMRGFGSRCRLAGIFLGRRHAVNSRLDHESLSRCWYDASSAAFGMSLMAERLLAPGRRQEASQMKRDAKRITIQAHTT